MRLEVSTASGPRYSRTVDEPLGAASNPLPEAQLREKFHALANPVIGQSVPLFFRLSDLFAGMDPAVAESFIAAWREKSVAGEFGHLPQLSPAAGVRSRAESARPAAAAAAEAPRRLAGEG